MRISDWSSDVCSSDLFADLVIWSPAFFGVKPDMILKGGSIAAAPMGDPNALIPTPQPVHYRPMFASFGRNMVQSSLTFVRSEERRGGKECVSTGRYRGSPSN